MNDAQIVLGISSAIVGASDADLGNRLVVALQEHLLGIETDIVVWLRSGVGGSNICNCVATSFDYGSGIGDKTFCLPDAWQDRQSSYVLENSVVGADYVLLLPGPDAVEGVLFLQTEHQLDEQLAVLDYVAVMVGSILANRRLLKVGGQKHNQFQLALAAYEDNIRLQVANEIHDRGINQLTFVRKLLKLGQSYQIVDAAIEKVIADLRQISDHKLLPEGLDIGLEQALKAFLHECQDVMGSSFELDIRIGTDEVKKLSKFVSTEIYYILREAVSNAYKAGAKAMVTIEKAEDCLVFTVVDCGPGFDMMLMNQENQKARGLYIMQARALRIGATISIDSTPGKGTSVVLEVKDSATS